MPNLKFRTVYSARDEEHKGIIFTSDSLCQQHFRDECNINVIVDRYVKTGVMEHLADVPPHFADVSEIPTDLASAYDAVFAAESAFMSLPSALRKSLDNDPARLDAWLHDDKNRVDAIKYGLLADNSAVSQESTNVEAKERSETPSEPSKTQ